MNRLSRFFHWAAGWQRTDPTWKPTGYRYRPGCDKADEQLAARTAAKREREGRIRAVASRVASAPTGDEARPLRVVGGAR